MNADDLKKLTTDSIDRLAEILDAGQSDQLAAFSRQWRVSIDTAFTTSA